MKRLALFAVVSVCLFGLARVAAAQYPGYEDPYQAYGYDQYGGYGQYPAQAQHPGYGGYAPQYQAPVYGGFDSFDASAMQQLQYIQQQQMQLAAQIQAAQQEAAKSPEATQQMLQWQRQSHQAHRNAFWRRSAEMDARHEAFREMIRN